MVKLFIMKDVYSCLEMKRFLEENKISFVVADVFEDDDSMQEMLRLGLSHVPMVRCGDVYFTDMDEFKKYIKNKLTIIR